jgi:hypothetical protein
VARAILLAAVAAALAGPPAPRAAERGDLATPLLRALAAGAVGEVEVRTYGEPTHPAGPPTPYVGVSVLLVPYAADVDARLDAVKARQRESMTAYVDAHRDVSSAREEYEQELRVAGGEELVRKTASDAAGALLLSGVPEGEWLLLGWREEGHQIKGARRFAKDAKSFPDVPVSTGYAAVSFWKVRITVRAGEATAVNLSDRSVWLTAVREEHAPPADSSRKPAPSKKRR